MLENDPITSEFVLAIESVAYVTKHIRGKSIFIHHQGYMTSSNEGKEWPIFEALEVSKKVALKYVAYLQAFASRKDVGARVKISKSNHCIFIG